MAIEDIKKGVDDFRKEVLMPGIDLNKRISLHVEKHYDVKDKTELQKKYFDWIKRVITSPSKQKAFQGYFINPVETTDITESLIHHFAKAINPLNVSIQFDDEDLSERSREFINEKAFPKYFARPSDLVAVDVKDGEPYACVLPLDSIVYIKEHHGQIKEIAYMAEREGKEVLVSHDDRYSYVTPVSNGTEKWSETETIPHNYAAPPVTFLSTFKSAKPYAHGNPFTTTLTGLDLYLKDSISIQMLGDYAKYPILYRHTVKCNGCVSEGHRCDGDGQAYIIEAGEKVLTKACDFCPKKQMAGPGSEVEVSYQEMPPNSSFGSPVNFVNPDVANLQYNEDKLRRDEERIMYKIAGLSIGDGNAQAKNEMQIRQAYEAQMSALNIVRDNFMRLHNFVLTMFARAVRSQTKPVVMYGEHYFIGGAKELQEKRARAIEMGEPQSVIAEYDKRIISSQFGASPVKELEAMVLYYAEPYQGRTWPELEKMNQQGLLNQDLLALKVGFQNAVTTYKAGGGEIVVSETESIQAAGVRIQNELLKQFVVE